jgi:hypothetical protein
MTGAAMQALSSFSNIPRVKESLVKAENYLKQKEKDDGSWNENASSTAWAIEGILSQGEKAVDWESTTGNTPLDYLATLQDTDGGIKDSNAENKIWKTAYVSSALSSKTWNQLMHKFTKENLLVAKTTKVSPTPKTTNSVAKVKNSANDEAAQNTATVLNAVTSLPTTQTPTAPKNNWFTRLLNSIF